MPVAEKIVSETTTGLEILRDAKRILETDGWTTGSFKCAKGKHCAVGAAREAAGRHPDFAIEPFSAAYPGYLAAIRALAMTVSPSVVRLIDKGDYSESEEPESAVLEELEHVVISYNDGRVLSEAGRKSVMRRFDEAIAKLS